MLTRIVVWSAFVPGVAVFLLLRPRAARLSFSAPSPPALGGAMLGGAR